MSELFAAAGDPQQDSAGFWHAPRQANERRDDPLVQWLVWLSGGAVLAWSLVMLLGASDWADHGRLLLALGLIATWRYSWGLLHLVRALIFLAIVFPGKRRRAAAVDLRGSIEHVYCIVCSFDIPEPQFLEVYSALVANSLDAGIPTTIVAAVTSDRDLGLLGDVLRRFDDPDSIRIVAQFQQGTGKRAAIAMAMRTIARDHPSRRSVTVMLDGDVVLEPGALEQSVRFLAADEGLAALTTNNDARLDRSDPGRQWYWLRFAQRHLLMSSLALSGRLLVLTGRFSVYRTPQLVAPGAIAAIENDSIEHWLHGHIRFLSGDDKSLWHHVLASGGRMLYLPHVKAVSFEAMPAGCGFAEGSTRLMLRWLGNTVRANGRALALGPARCGPFLWWSLLDQRLSVASTLFGVSTALMLAVFGHPIYLPAYLAWVVVSRSIVSAGYGLLWGYYHPSWPLLLAYNQIWGALLKLHLFFRPDRQSWTRQHIDRNSSTHALQRTADALCAITGAALLAAAAAMTNLLPGT